MRDGGRVSLGRFWRLIGSVSVGTKIMGIVLGLVLLLGVGVTVQVRATMAQVLRREMGERGVSIARDLAARSTDLILTNDLFGLQIGQGFYIIFGMQPLAGRHFIIVTHQLFGHGN